MSPTDSSIAHSMDQALAKASSVFASVFQNSLEDPADNEPILFAAGPAALPRAVMHLLQQELITGPPYSHLGLDQPGNIGSLLSLSHRSKSFEALLADLEHWLRQLLSIPRETHEILFLQGGGTAQFSSIPLHLAGKATKAQTNFQCDYLVSGQWSKKAAEEASRLGVRVNAIKGDEILSKSQTSARFTPTVNCPFVYYCENETVDGIQLGVEFLDKAGLPEDARLVADVSSSLLSAPLQVQRHAVLFAGAQKNAGTAGVTLVVVRRDVLADVAAHLQGQIIPIALDWQTQAAQKSLYNTPPVYAIYVMWRVVQWCVALGGSEGLSFMKKRQEMKASKLYSLLDQPTEGNYALKAVVQEKSIRSLINITFRVTKRQSDGSWNVDKDAEQTLIKEALKAGFLEIAGHRSVGGLRVSLYNAASVAQVEKFVNWLEIFMKNWK